MSSVPAVYKVGSAKAMAEVARASYCGSDSNVNEWTCEACKQDAPAFNIVPSSISHISLPDLLNDDAIFIFVAKANQSGLFSTLCSWALGALALGHDARGQS